MTRHPLKAFVSSTFEDLKDHRAHVIRELRDAGIFVDPMENWTSSSDEPKRLSVERMRDCDLCVLLVAFRRGFVPEGEAESITQLEYRYAIEHGIDVLPFLLDEDAPWLSRFDKRLTDQKVGEWRRVLRERHAVPTFGLTPQSVKIAPAITRWIDERAHRTERVRVAGDQRGVTQAEEPAISIARLPVSGDKLYGRDDVLRRLDEAWDDARTNLVCLIGFAGTGKSAAVNHWLTRFLTAADYRGARGVYGWSFESQEADQQEASADAFITDLFNWLAEPEVPANPWERGCKLAEVLKRQRYLLILDAFEAVQYPPGPDEGKIKDQSLQALLKNLAAQNHGLCVVTSRLALVELGGFAGKTVQHVPVDQLTPEAGGALLEDLGVVGKRAQLFEAVREYRGHALSLTLLGTYLKEVKNGDITRRTELNLDEPDGARRVMRSYEPWLGEGPEIDLLRVLGLFNRPAPLGAVNAVREEPPIPGLTDHLSGLTREKWNRAVARLRKLKLLAEAPLAGPDSWLDCHAMVRHHFAQQLREERPEAWGTANDRLFEYYRRQPRVKVPDTLEEMADLFQAVIHGCRAGRHQEAWSEVYWPRIRQGEDGFSVTSLNAYSADLVAVSSFFDNDWTRPVRQLDSMWAARACTEAGFDLRGLGRLDEAIEAYRTGLAALRKDGHWWSACDAAGNLSELLTLYGQLERARSSAEESVDLARRALESETQPEEPEKVQRTLSTNVASVADVLHQMGRLQEAEEQFRRAEEIYLPVRPEVHYLHALRGYHFCDLLLTVGKLDDVEKRAAAGIEVDRRDGRLYGVGLGHLAQARRALIVAQGTADGDLGSALMLTSLACEELRQAGHQELIVRSRLVAGEVHRVSGDLDAARADLTEALESAERGQMRLLEIDAHLQLVQLEDTVGDRKSARMFWERASRAIRECGYHRRDTALRSVVAQLELQG